MSDAFKPVAYIKEGCPYSMKLLQYIEQEGLDDRIDIVRVSVGTTEMEAVREKLSKVTPHAQFPTVEIEPGTFKSESDELIDYFAEKFGQTRH